MIFISNLKLAVLSIMALVTNVLTDEHNGNFFIRLRASNIYHELCSNENVTEQQVQGYEVCESKRSEIRAISNRCLEPYLPTASNRKDVICMRVEYKPNDTEKEKFERCTSSGLISIGCTNDTCPIKTTNETMAAFVTCAEEALNISSSSYEDFFNWLHESLNKTIPTMVRFCNETWPEDVSKKAQLCTKYNIEEKEVLSKCAEKTWLKSSTELSVEDKRGRFCKKPFRRMFDKNVKRCVKTELKTMPKDMIDNITRSTWPTYSGLIIPHPFDLQTNYLNGELIRSQCINDAIGESS